MNAQRRQRLLGIAAIVVVAVWAGDRLVRTPLVRAWDARAERLAGLRKSVAQGTVLLDREAAIRARWEQMRTFSLTNQVSVAESQVLKAFDRWSRDSGISVSSIRPQWKQSPTDLTTLECRVAAAGNLAAISRFLYEIEKDPLGIKVDSLEITTRDNEGQQLTLGLQVSGLVLVPAPSGS